MLSCLYLKNNICDIRLIPLDHVTILLSNNNACMVSINATYVFNPDFFYFMWIKNLVEYLPCSIEGSNFLNSSILSMHSILYCLTMK